VTEGDPEDLGVAYAETPDMPNTTDIAAAP